MYSAHIVIAEVRRGVITQESYEAVSFARDCSGGLLPAVVLLGKDVSLQAEDLAEKTGCTVHVIQGDHLGSFNAEESCAAIADLIYSVIVDTQGTGQPAQAGRSLNSDWRNFVTYVEEADDINSRFNSFGCRCR